MCCNGSATTELKLVKIKFYLEVKGDIKKASEYATLELQGMEKINAIKKSLGLDKD